MESGNTQGILNCHTVSSIHSPIVKAGHMAKLKNQGAGKYNPHSKFQERTKQP